MCVFYDQEMTNKLKETISHETIFYKVYALTPEGHLLCPYFSNLGPVIPNENGEILSDRINLTPGSPDDTKFQDTVLLCKGIHVFIHKEDAVNNAHMMFKFFHHIPDVRMVVLPVFAKPEDFVGAGYPDMWKITTQPATAVFMKVSVNLEHLENIIDNAQRELQYA